MGTTDHRKRQGNTAAARRIAITENCSKSKRALMRTRCARRTTCTRRSPRRRWDDVGCGALGDMGSYSYDTIFRVLKLEAPVSAEASSSERYEETYPLASIVRYNFAARGEMPAVKFTWYDGGLKPPRPEELEENRPMKVEGEEEDEGLLFVGDRGKILGGFNGSHPEIIPQAKMD